MGAARIPQVTSDRLRELLHYDPDTGVFTWMAQVSTKKPKGCQAGTLRQHGYRVIKVDGENVYEHRLAWFWMTGEWPKHEIDHVDTSRSNNRWSNLREATHSENLANATMRIDNTSGTKGVYFHKPSNGWLAFCNANGKTHYVGYFKSKDRAVEAMNQKRAEVHGEFARYA